jgi:hypothetical protein
MAQSVERLSSKLAVLNSNLTKKKGGREREEGMEERKKRMRRGK